MLRSLVGKRAFTASLPCGRCSLGFSAQKRFGSGRNKFVSAEDAAWLVESDSTITVGGFVAQGTPEEILLALEQRFKETGSPSGLTLVFGGGPGDWALKGLNHLAQPGMLRRTVGAHYGQVPELAKLAQANLIEAYNLPMGSISRMIRAAAAGQPGHLTKVGFGTLADPKLGGGRINSVSKDDVVIEVEIEGVKYLLYKAIPIDVALVRGTTSDADGNVTMERESLYADHMMMAMAARASAIRRGVSIVQVERKAANGSLHPRAVKIPGTMIDAVVVAKPENHYMSFPTPYNPAATGEIRAPVEPPMTVELDERKIIARRAALELTPGQVINLGIGMPEGVADVCSEESVTEFVELTTEPGVHGGVGLSGHDFGPAVNYNALIEMHEQFDFYNGGGLDATFLGMAECDPNGDVNVTRVGNKLTGPGGFIDISQCTKRVTLLGTFTAGGLEVRVQNNQINIVKEGRVKKFVKKVKEITFSGTRARENKQTVHYVTERCVFGLKEEGLTLLEIAPGIDLQRDILDQMEFKPLINGSIATMNSAIFNQGLMYLRKLNFILEWPERLSYDEATNTVYINNNHLRINSLEDISTLERAFDAFFATHAVNGKAHVIINYDGFELHPDLVLEFKQCVAKLEAKYYLSVRRYTTRTFAYHRLRNDIRVDDAREYSLADVQLFLKKHGFMCSADNAALAFNSRLQERRLAEGKPTLQKITAEGFHKLIEAALKSQGASK